MNCNEEKSWSRVFFNFKKIPRLEVNNERKELPQFLIENQTYGTGNVMIMAQIKLMTSIKTP
jgi:hypothetical protein